MNLMHISVKFLTVGLVLGALSGCGTARVSQSEPVAVYRPDLRRFDPGFMAVGGPAAPSNTDATDIVPAVSGTGGGATETVAAPARPLPTPTVDVAAGGPPVGDVARPKLPRRGRTLTPGDDVEILIHVRDQLHIKDRLDENGRVTLPIVGSVRISDMTAAAAEKTIQSLYVDRQIYRAGTIEVTVVATAPPFFVTGEILKPSAYPLRDGGLTLSMAITMAGGLTPYSDAKRIAVKRGGIVREYNLRKIQDGKAPDIYIEPDDVITVPRGIW